MNPQENPYSSVPTSVNRGKNADPDSGLDQDTQLSMMYEDRAAEVLKKLKEKGVGDDMANAFASVEVSIMEAKAEGASLDEIFDTVQDDSHKLIAHLMKNPRLKNIDNSRIVFERVKVLMKEDSKKLFVDALMEAVRDREYSVTAGGTLYEKGGFVSADKESFEEDGLPEVH